MFRFFFSSRWSFCLIIFPSIKLLWRKYFLKFSLHFNSTVKLCIFGSVLSFRSHIFPGFAIGRLVISKIYKQLFYLFLLCVSQVQFKSHHFAKQVCTLFWSKIPSQFFFVFLFTFRLVLSS